MIIDKIFEIAEFLSEKMQEKNMTFSAAKKEVARIMRQSIRPKIKGYFLSLLFLFLLAWLPPLVLLIIGVSRDSNSFIVLSGCLRAIFTIILLFWTAPLGILLEIVLGGLSGSGERYAKLILAIFITELFFTLIACFIPFANRPDLISPFILAAFILGFMNAWFFQPKIIASITGIIFFVIITAFFVPNMPFINGWFDSLFLKTSKGLYGPNLISKSCEELETNGIFWAADGSNKYWYHKSTKGEIRLYDGKGNDVIEGQTLKPLDNPNILDIYCRQLDKISGAETNENSVGGNSALGSKKIIAILDFKQHPEWFQSINVGIGKYNTSSNAHISFDGGLNWTTEKINRFEVKKNNQRVCFLTQQPIELKIFKSQGNNWVIYDPLDFTDGPGNARTSWLTPGSYKFSSEKGVTFSLNNPDNFGPAGEIKIKKLTLIVVKSQSYKKVNLLRKEE